MTLVKSVPLKFVDYFRHEITPNKIDLSYPVLVANSTRTNYAFAIGNRTQELTVNLSNAASQNLEIFQGNINLTCTAGEPTSASTVCLVRLRYTHDTTDMTYLRLRAINSYTLIEKELQDAYGCIHGIDFYTNSVTVNGEAAVGVFNMECNSTVTGTVRGVIVNVYGNGVPSTTSVGLEVRIDGSSAGTLTEGIRIRAVGGNTITTGLRIYGAAADKIGKGIDVAVTSSVTGKNGIYVHDTFTATGATVHKAIQGDVTYSATGRGTPIGVAGKVLLTGNFTGGAGYCWGVQGQMDFRDNCTMNDADSVFAGGRFVLTEQSKDGWNHTDGHLCVCLIDSLLETSVTLTSGQKSLLRIGNWGQNENWCTFDATFYVMGRGTDNLFYFLGCLGGDSFITEETSDPTGEWTHKIKVRLHEGDLDRYIMLCTDPTG